MARSTNVSTTSKKRRGKKDEPELGTAGEVVEAPVEHDCYHVLGVDRDATGDEIRAAFKRAVMDAHPDRGGNEAGFVTLQTSYEILSDPRKRHIYDRFGAAGLEERVETLFAREFRDGTFGPKKADPNESPQVEALRRQNESLQRQLMIVKPDEGNDFSKTFEAWLRNKNPGELRVLTSKDLAEELGVSEESYEPVALPTLKSPGVEITDLGKLHEVVKETTFELPSKLKWGEVLVHMLAAPVAALDHHLAAWGYIPGETVPEHPFTAGSQGVGVVIRVGPGVDNLALYDFVLPTQPASGTWRRLGVFRESQVLRFPTTTVEPKALCHFFSHVIAFRLLEDFGALMPGDTVIQNNAQSAVGQSVIQLCRILQMKTINLIDVEAAEFDATVDRLSALGATHVWKNEGSVMERLKRAKTALPRLAIDAVGGSSLHRLTECLRPDSELVCYGATQPRVEPFPYAEMLYKGVSLSGFWLYKWMRDNSEGMVETAQRLLPLMEAGRLNVESETWRVGDGNLREALRRHGGNLELHFGTLEDAKKLFEGVEDQQMH